MAAETWRERDLGGGRGPVPGSVGIVVRRTYLGLRWALWAESVLLGIGAWSLSLASLSASGAAWDGRGAWAAALLAGLACGAAWFLERRQSAAQVAARLDRRLRHQGALQTAFELEQAGAPSPMAELLVRRVLRRLRTKEALQALRPSVALPVAAPLLGIGLLALALEERRAEDVVALDLSSVSEGIATAMGAVEERARSAGLGPAEARQVFRLSQRSLEVARRLEGGAERRDELPQVEAELAELERELVEMDAQLGADPELRRALGETRNWLDAARMRVRSGGEVASGLGSAGGAARALGGAEPSPREDPDPSVGDAFRTPDSESDSAGGTESDPTLGVGPRRGTLTASSWPSEYDGIVSRWMELLSRSGTERAPDVETENQ